MLSLLLFLFTFVSYNCENLFDTQHDEGKEDFEFLPSSSRHWTPHRYWQKLGHIGQAIASCGTVGGALPDLVVLTEVENDSVMRDLTRRSLLRTARYEYVMTDSPDLRGIDVAVMWSPFAFGYIRHHAVRVEPLPGHRPTRDILYVAGRLQSGDTLHVLAVHAPSRAGGEAFTQPYRMRVAQLVSQQIDSIQRVSSHPLIVVAGDFNDYSGDAPLRLLEKQLTEITKDEKAIDSSYRANGKKQKPSVEGTYRYKGRWGSLDHIFCNPRLATMLQGCGIHAAPFLLEPDRKYGGVKPRRTYLGPRYLGGYSDHLPVVATFQLK